MHGNRLHELLLFLGIITLSGSIGLLGGWLFPSLLLGTLCYTLRHVYHLARLPGIIAGRQLPPARTATGLWADAVQALDAAEAGRQLRENDQARWLAYFRNTVAALPDAVIILQEDDSIVWTNAAACRLFGIPAEHATGQHLAEVVDDPMLDEYLAAGSNARPLVLSAPADRTKTLTLQTIPIDSGNARQILVARDISRQHHLDVSQRDFIANISHELRTPLTVIAGLLEQLEDELSSDEPARRMTGIMQTQAARMRDLITDLLQLAQIETVDYQPRHESVRVPEMLQGILEEVRTLACESRHVLIPDISSEYGLYGNAGELRTAFTNLVVNAIRHTPDRAEVRVNWSADSSGARFCVSDTGAGIAARHIPRLTERFYRVDPGRSRDTGGTGLGLSIVRQILDHHDAELEISSTTGRGSTFTCHFPAARTVRLEQPPQPEQT